MKLNDEIQTGTKEEKQRAAAFLNSAIKNGDGSVVAKSSSGFPIYQNPKYPNAYNDMLVNLAEKHGGSVKLHMEVIISLNKKQPVSEINLDDIDVIPAD